VNCALIEVENKGTGALLGAKRLNGERDETVKRRGSVAGAVAWIRRVV
jgi:hypothetical protein